MDREIKFRGKRIDNGEWVYGNYYSDGWMCSGVRGEAHYIKPFVGENHEVEYETVGQFTGLTDKNGKEIYEGDIVFSDSWNPKEMEVRFYEGAFMLYYEGCEPYLIDLHYVETEFVVIGNIHEDEQ